MTFNASRMSSILVVLVATLGAASAQAQSARVRCDVFPDRSRASVDGRDLAPGDYTAVLTSGDHVKQSPAQAAVGGEAEFDFDSNPRDVRQGATKIGKHFIVGDKATGQILDAAGNVVATETATCRQR